MANEDISHALYSQAIRMLSKEMTIAKPGKIIAFIGVSGSGKSHAREEIEKWLISQYKNEMDADRSFIPFISHEIVPPNADKRRSISWKSVYAHLLEELFEPLIDKKRVVDIRDDGKVKYKNNVNEEDLAHIISKCLQRRRTKYVILDESAHILRAKADDSVAKQNMDILKSLASRGNTVLVLFGTFDLLRNMMLNPEVMRRVKVVTIGNYKAGMENDWRNLIFSVAQKVCNLSNLLSRVLCDDYEYFNQHTLGVPGLLIDWFEDVSRSIELDGKSAPELTLPEIRTYLEDRKPSNAAKHASLKAIEESEAILNGYNQVQEQLVAPKMKKIKAPQTKKPALRKKTKARSKVDPQ